MERYSERHHILYNRTAWESNKNTRWLREESGLIVPMGHDAHSELHDDVTVVPLLDHNTAMRVRSIMLRNNKITGSRDVTGALDTANAFMSAVEQAGKNPKANSLDRKLGELVIEAIQGQRPYIEDGVIKARVFDMGAQRKRHNPYANLDLPPLVSA